MSIRTLGALGLLLIAPAYAATSINETRPLDADGTVHIENLKGSIVVRTWAQPQVRVTGSLGRGAEKLVFGGSARALTIEVQYPENGRNLWGQNRDASEPSVLNVMVPQRASLDVESVSANVDIQQMAGRKLEVASVSGAIVVTASSPGEAEVGNVSGDTMLRITTRRASASSVSGDISLQGGLTGEVSLESVSGDISLVSPGLDRLQVNSVSGDAVLRTAMKPGGTIDAETLSGTLDLRLPATTGARLSAESFSGDILSPKGKVDREEYGPGKSLEATLGNGQGRIDLQSFSGDVRIQLD